VVINPGRHVIGNNFSEKGADSMEGKEIWSSGYPDNTDTVYEKGKLYHLSLNNLLADPNQPRKLMEAQALDELTASILKHGILEPILFRRHEDGNLIVVAGERRIVAARKAGMTNIPAMYVDGNSSEIALIENLMRQDLTAVEEAEALQRLVEQQKYTHEQLSDVIGKARTTISDILLINRLPQEIRNECRGNRAISKNILIEIARKKQDRAMFTAYNSYKEKLQKTKQTRQGKGNINDSYLPAAMIGMADKLLTRLGNCDMTGCNEEELKYLRIKLIDLRDFIGAFLSGSVLSSPYKVEEMPGESK
jgi:ParB family transcriptional regulator, chromosome partitioning protein